MIKTIRTIFCCLLMLTATPAWSDTYTDVTRVNTAEGNAAPAEMTPSGFHGSLGVSLFNYKSIVGDSARKTSLMPMVMLAYQDWAYWSMGGGGVWLFQTEDHAVKLGLGIKMHRGLKLTDDPAYAGMSERRRSVDGGVNLMWKMRSVSTSLNYYTDLGNASRGSSAALRFSHSFRLSPEFSLTPRVGADWQSARVVDYAYGVRASEATATRPFYAGRSTVNYSAGLNIGYRLDRAWSLNGGLNYTHFGRGIVDSPLVSQSNATFVYLGAGWRF